MFVQMPAIQQANTFTLMAKKDTYVLMNVKKYTMKKCKSKIVFFKSSVIKGGALEITQPLLN